jgi:hypothetical protein
VPSGIPTGVIAAAFVSAGQSLVTFAQGNATSSTHQQQRAVNVGNLGEAAVGITISLRLDRPVTVELPPVALRCRLAATSLNRSDRFFS